MTDLAADNRQVASTVTNLVRRVGTTLACAVMTVGAGSIAAHADDNPSLPAFTPHPSEW